MASSARESGRSDSNPRSALQKPYWRTLTGLSGKEMPMLRNDSATMAARLIVVFVLVLLAGCASQQIVYEKPGVTKPERQRDENDCLRSAIGVDGYGRLLAPYCIDRDAYRRCMEARGYVVQTEQ
jgi:hypothetical protein